MKRAHGRLFPREDNPWWPLPPDYLPHTPDDERATLTEEGRRLARVNACRLQQTPQLAVHAWDFFCRYYLRPYRTAAEEYVNPGFYQEWVRPSVFHYHMIRGFEEYPRFAGAFPRGGAKSTVAYSYALWKLITVQSWLANVYLSKFKPFVQRASDMLRTQIEFNDRLIEDFGQLKPARGTGVWSTEYFRLRNYSAMALWSIDGKLRGPRANWNGVDDIEQDPDGRLPSPDDIEAIQLKMLKVLVPMLRGDSHMAIFGTIFHPRSFINYLLSDPDPDSPDFDPRFASTRHGGRWYKMRFGWCDASGKSLWPEVFTEQFISQMRQELGPAHFATEFENRPMSEEHVLFTIEPEKHEYRLTEPDEHTYTDPMKSDSVVHWHECSGRGHLETTPQSAPWREHISSMIRGITIDPTRSASATSDFAVIAVGGIDYRGDLWLLDLWAGKADNTEVCQVLWPLVVRWQIPLIGVEDTGFSDEFFYQKERLEPWFLSELGFSPQCLSLKPSVNMHKGQRIKRLQWRYTYGKIKYPVDRCRQHPWPMLYDQTLRFTEDLANLKHDDCIDAVEMLQQLLKGQKAVIYESPSNPSPAERFLAGERTIPGTDIPLLQPYDLHTLDPETLSRVVDAVSQPADPDDWSDDWPEGTPAGDIW